MLVTVAMNGLFVWKYKMTPLLTAVHFSLGFSLSSFVEIFIFSTVLKISIGSFISILALQIISNFSLTFFPGVVSGKTPALVKNLKNAYSTPADITVTEEDFKAY